MQTFNQFIKAQYESCTCKRGYGSLNNFKNYYIASFGLHDWLETLRGQTLTLSDTNHLISAFVAVNKIKASMVPALFRDLDRLYHIRFPVVFGIFTAEYWGNFLSKRQQIA